MRKINLMGQKFGSLMVIAEAGRHKSGKVLWHCVCDCGKEHVTTGHMLTSGKTRTCGKCYSVLYRVSDDGTHMIGTLPNGTEFLFDTEDYEKVISHIWYQKDTGYIVTFIDGKYTSIHRLIADAPADILIDHINLDKIDNRKSNLRFATAKENRRNVGIRKDSRTGAKGVSYNRKRNKYVAQIYANGKQLHLGYYSTVLEAAQAYNRAAEYHYGEFAWLNDISNLLKTPEFDAGVFSFAAK